MADSYDYLVLGAGMGGLTVASLLARAGHSVCVLEAHEYPGGCAHSFPMGDYTFCAAVHYIFYCGEGEPIYNFLKKLDLHEAVRFCRLDPEGYDHFRCPAENLHVRIPNGLDKWAERLIDRFPHDRAGLCQFFAVMGQITRELRQMPFRLGWPELLAVPLRFPAIAKYRNWTLQRLFDRLALRSQVQAVLATQIGDLGLPPRDVSLVIFAALIWSYGLGAYYPEQHFRHFIDAIAGRISESPGCAIEYEAEVRQLHADRRRITAVVTRDGRTFRGRRVICNLDPQACVKMIGEQHFPRSFLRKVQYDYSVGSYTIYLGVRGLDLREFGFGAWNVWHYPQLDINAVYDRQTRGNDLDDPWLFMSTPTLCANGAAARICPEGDQILELVTVCDYDAFRQLREDDRQAYHQRKQQITGRILEMVERHYIPGLRKHIVLKVSGTPTTNVRYLWAPRGNIYGSALSPANVHFGRLKFDSPFENLYFTGASAEFPSIGATVLGGSRLYTHLTGDPVNPGRDLDGLW